jgi:hypothetical protein
MTGRRSGLNSLKKQHDPISPCCFGSFAHFGPVVSSRWAFLFKESRMTIVIHAPQGAGKSRFASELADFFHSSCIAEEWNGRKLPDGSLALCNQIPSNFPDGEILVIDLATACEMAGIDIKRA